MNRFAFFQRYRRAGVKVREEEPAYTVFKLTCGHERFSWGDERETARFFCTQCAAETREETRGEPHSDNCRCSRGCMRRRAREKWERQVSETIERARRVELR